MNSTTPSLTAEQCGAAKEAELWTPRIYEATGCSLNLKAFTGDPNCTFGPWLPFGKPGQRVTLHIESEGSKPLEVLNRVAMTEKEAAEGVNIRLRRSWLEALRPGSKFSVKVSVALCPNDSDSTAVELPPGVYSMSLISGLEVFTYPVAEIYKPHKFPSGLICERLGGGRGSWLSVRESLADPGSYYLFIQETEARCSFDTPPSTVSFMIDNGGNDVSKQHYRVKEIGNDIALPIAIPEPEPGSHFAIVSFSSNKGIEYFDISTNDIYYRMAIDNVSWE